MDEKYIIPTLTAVAGGIISHIWNKFKNRLSIIDCFITHAPLGRSVEDPRFGTVKILYNDNPVKNLFFSRLLLVNKSGKDLSNIEVNIVSSNSNSHILMSDGRNLSKFTELQFTSKYSSALEKATTTEPQLLPYVYSRRDYVIPVMNRGEQVEVGMLIADYTDNQPFLLVSCNTAGVLINLALMVPSILGEPERKSAIIGTLISLMLLIPIFYFIDNKALAVGLAGLVGLIAVLLGVLVLKCIKLIVRFLG